MRRRNQNIDNSLLMIGLVTILFALKHSLLVVLGLLALYGIYYFLKK